MNVPELEPHCNSWVITTHKGMVCEMYSRANVDEIAKQVSACDGWLIETAATYLGRMNADLRAKANRIEQ